MDAAKGKHDAKLTAWAEDHGKKRNVRTLLSTMHGVRWRVFVGRGWGRCGSLLGVVAGVFEVDGWGGQEVVGAGIWAGGKGW